MINPEIINDDDFDEGEALAELLTSSNVFINSYWWMKEEGWPEKAHESFAVCANCSDCFMWACADAEEVLFKELRSVYEHYKADPSWGVSVWCIKKRKMLPQKPVYDYIMKAGIWDLDKMDLEPNFYDVWCANQRINNTKCESQ